MELDRDEDNDVPAYLRGILRASRGAVDQNDAYERALCVATSDEA
jgi:hypothetical protein